MQKLQSKIGNFWHNFLQSRMRHKLASNSEVKQVQEDIRHITHWKIIEETIATVVSCETESQNSHNAWLSVEGILKSKVAEFPELADNLFGLVLHTFILQANIKPLPEIDLVEVRFSNNQTAKVFISFLSHFLPILEETYPHHDGQIITLTSQQFHFCNLYLSSNYAGELAEIIADHYLLKSLRSDEFDYSHRFIMGIIPNERGTRRQNLRPYTRRTHTVTHEKKIVARLDKKPMYSEREKHGFSQIQSTTFIDTKMRSSVFGAFKQRTNKLYGVLTHCSDALMNRLLTRDNGTVARPFDISLDNNDLVKVSEEWKRNDIIYSPNNIEEFKKQNLKRREKQGGTNEVLARLRYNPFRTVVCICADTLEARLLAYDFSEELFLEFSCYAKANNIKLNPRFKIPIVFYLPYGGDLTGKVKQHRVLFYNESMRLSDLAQSKSLYDNAEIRREKFSRSDYEILLGQTTITLEMLMQPGSVNNSSIAIDMVDRGYVRMLMRLLRSNNLREALFDELLNQKLIKQNDSIISHFIEVEAFDIADKLLRETNSNIDQLFFRERTLIEYILSYGTPRQVDYLCNGSQERPVNRAEEILRKMAESGCWHTIRLYLKEYPVQDKKVLGSFLSEHSWRKILCDSKFIIQRGADLTVVNRLNQTPIVFAASNNDWELVSLICAHYTDFDGAAQFGVALVLALCKKKMNLVDKLLSAGAKPPQDFYMHDTKQLKELIVFVATHSKKETFAPFINGIKFYWHDSKELFLDSCRAKNYCIPEFLLTLDLKVYFSSSLPRNDPLMSSLIIDEQFQIADKLIEGTRSDRFQLTEDSTLLADHIIEKGTLKQFNYMGQEKMFTRLAQITIIQNRNWGRLRHWLDLVEASQGLDEKFITQIVNSLCASRVHWLIPDWVAMRNFVEQYLSHFSPALLGKVLVIAFNDSQFLFANYLLEKGADRTSIREFRFSIECAAECKKWDFVLVLCQKTPDDGEDALMYGEVLLSALRCREAEVAKKLLDQGAIPSWKIAGGAYPLATIGFYQLIDKIGNLSDSELDSAIYRCYFQSISEMLLTLPEVSSWQLLWEVYSGRPFAIEMIENGHSTTLITLLTKHELYTTNVIRSASIRNYLKKNNSFISECICENKFALADKLLKATRIDKDKLQYKGYGLADHLVYHGTFEQWMYFGFDAIVLEIAQKKYWDWVMGEIDRNRNLFGPVFLGKLFYEACRQQQSRFAKRLLSYGADVTYSIDYKPPLVYLVDEQRWDFVELFCDYPSDEKDDAEYGYAVVQALRNNKVQLARTLFDRGAIHVDRSNISSLLESAVFYAVKLDLIDWIPQLIKYELRRGEKSGWEIKVNKYSARQFRLCPFSFHQILLARDLAEFKNNNEIMSYFEEFNSLDFSAGCSLASWYCDEWDHERILTAQFFIEALAMNEVQFAAHRLIKYALKYKLISIDEGSVSAVLSKIASHCFYAIKIYNSDIRETIYLNLRRILEQEIQCGNIPANENAHHGNLTFFPNKSSDKLFVARVLSSINVNEINSYAEYLNRSVVQRVEVIEDDQKISPAVLVYG
ncbi:MAG: ankyrin repeat domain-containing protein [Gammaproteobacteria bacterium]|nr:ankyrin repeat domain-containing protein [Gammaproteobacteria bacterium]